MTSEQNNILGCAVTIFAQKGYDGCSLRAISDAAGVNVAMIAYYFGSKRGLMEAVLQQYDKALRERLEWASRNAGPRESSTVTRRRAYWVFMLVESPACFHLLLSHAAMAGEEFPRQTCRDALGTQQELVGFNTADFGRIVGKAFLSPRPFMDWPERRRRALLDEVVGSRTQAPAEPMPPTRPAPEPSPVESEARPVAQGDEYLDGFID